VAARSATVEILNFEISNCYIIEKFLVKGLQKKLNICSCFEVIFV